MGQHVELAFVGFQPITSRMLLNSLESAGLRLVEEEEMIAWFSWTPQGLPIRVAANLHQDSEGRNHTLVSFDSNALAGSLPLSDCKLTIDSFLEVGVAVWNSLNLYEGTLAPGDAGPLLIYRDTADREEVRGMAALQNYARFLGPELRSLLSPESWVQLSHPKCEVRPVERGGLLVIWDNSVEGVKRFLSLF